MVEVERLLRSAQLERHVAKIVVADTQAALDRDIFGVGRRQALADCQCLPVEAQRLLRLAQLERHIAEPVVAEGQVALNLVVLGVGRRPTLIDGQGPPVEVQRLLRLAQLECDVAKSAVAYAQVASGLGIAGIGHRQLARQFVAACILFFRSRRVAQDPLHVAHLEVRPDERMIRVALPLGLLEQLLQALSGVLQKVLAQGQGAGTVCQLPLDAGDHVVQGVQRELEPLPGLVAGRFRPPGIFIGPPGVFIRASGILVRPVALHVGHDRQARGRQRQHRKGRDRGLPQAAIATGLLPRCRDHRFHFGFQLEPRGVQLLRLLQGLPGGEQQVGPPAFL